MLVLTSRAFATTFTVTDTSDNASDTGSLRYAVNTAVNGDTIVFNNVIGTITLTNGALTISHSITITGPGAGLLTISGNNASQIFIINPGIAGTVSIAGLTLANANNSSGSGGAIINSGTLQLSSCVFDNNTSGNNSGGAVYNLAVLQVSSSTFTGNSNSAGGGAIANYASLTVVGSTFSGNSAAAGGGIYNGAGTALIENSTLFGNNVTGGGPGGGIFAGSGSTTTIQNSTIYGNLNGSGIFDNGGVATITLTNSIVSGNTGGDCDQCGNQSSNNLIGGTPNLSPLQFNGGLTQTLIPLPGSPAIGAGSGCVQNTDQRSFARPITGACDLGAVQTNYYTVTNLNDSGAGSLRQAITDAIASTGSSGDVVFQSGLTGAITLASTLPAINTSNINIEGPGANVLSISGNSAVSVFNISGITSVVNLRGLTIENGQAMPASGQPGGLSNNGQTTIEDCAFNFNTGDTGGAIYNEFSLTVRDSTFLLNVPSSVGGGGILNQRTLIVMNATFNDNRAYNVNGGGLDNMGTAIVEDSTFSGNEVLNGGVGGGIYNDPGQPLLLENNVVSGNLNLQTNTADDCAFCGTPGAGNLIGGTADLGALAYNGSNATLQTMIPLPGSVAIQGGDPTQLPPSLVNDERGFPRTTGGKLDIGAVQTNYISVNFVEQPSTTLVNATIVPSVTVNVLETNGNSTDPRNADPVAGIPITLTFSGTGTLSGTLTQTTTSSIANFADLKVNAAGTGDTLSTAVTVTGSQTLTATSNPFDVVLPTPTVQFNPPLPASVTYGVAPLTLKATVTNSAGQPTGQTVSFQVDSGPAIVNGNVLTITGAGSVVVEVDAIANGTYGAADATATIVVNKAALTVTAANASRVYGTANPIFTGTYTGAVNGDTFNVSGTTAATASSPAGTYPITPTATGTNLADYTVTYINGTLTVTKATLTVTAANASRVYGAANPAFSGTYTGAVNGDNFTISGATAATASSSVGTYPITPTATGVNLADYTVTYINGTLTVTKATLTVTAANTSRVYGAANPIFTGTYTGAVNSDTFTVSGTTTATASSPVGAYPIIPTAAGANLSDYTVTYIDGTLTVTKAVLTATAASGTRIYGTPNPGFTGTLTGAVNGDTFVETFSSTATMASNVGSYPIVPAVSGANLAQYTLVTVPGTLTVAQAASKMALSASATQVTPGTPVTLTATVTSTTTGIPTGTVIFMSGGTQLGTATLNPQGVGTLTVTNLPIGVNTITAIYSGDIDFTGSQAQLNQTIVVGTPSFTMTATPTGLNIPRGSAGVTTVTLTPAFGYTGTVTFNCTNLPVGSACHFQPGSVTLDGTNPVRIVVAIQINSAAHPGIAGSTAWLRPLKPLRSLPVLPAMFFWLPGTDWSLEGDKKAQPVKRRKPFRVLWIVALLALTAGVLGIAGCAGLSPNYPPTGETTINVIALGSGGINQSVAIKVNIQ